MAEPTDFINLADWLQLNQSEGQRMGQALTDDVNKHVAEADHHLMTAQQNALGAIPWGGSSDLTSYGEYVTAQRSASEAQVRAGLYGTSAGRQEGLRRAFGGANAFDSALVGASGWRAPERVGQLDGKLDAARRNISDAGAKEHEWQLRKKATEERMWAEYAQNQKDREAKAAEAKRRKDIIDRWKPIITQDYWHHRGQGRGQEHAWGDPAKWTEEQWWSEARRKDELEDQQSLRGPMAGR